MTNNKTEIFTFRLDEKTHYLAELASRKLHMKFSDFVRMAIVNGVARADEMELMPEKYRKLLEFVKLQTIVCEFQSISKVISAQTWAEDAKNVLKEIGEL